VLHGPWWSRIGLAATGLLTPAAAQRLWRWLPGERVAEGLALHPFDGLTAYRQGNGIATTLAHDAAGRLSALKVDGVFERRLRYGAGPRIAAAEDRLPAMRRVAYEYNSLGMLRRAPAAASAAAGEVLRDSLGNIASDGRYRYRSTPAGQIERVTSLSGRPLAHYRYDALGQRVAKTVYPDGQPPRTTWYLWQQGRLVAEIAGSGPRRGAIQAQYLYLNEGAKALPLAKLETAEAEGNRSGGARLLHIHNDQRGAPVAMTDSQRRIVWRADVDAWGWATPATGNTALLNLRLPGQYYDAETGLADNHHRSYDARPASPLRGSYLSPDPLGHTDGGNPYRYAGGDPLNRIDPAGLYQVDMHYYMTFFLAIMAGVDYRSARVTALASQFVDDNALTHPLDDDSPVGSVSKNQNQLLLYHFVLNDATGKVLPAYRNGNTSAAVGLVNYSPQLKNLAGASQRASGCAHYQLLGEFLHAYADTFSHRDQANQPYDALFAGLGLGHGGALSEPDYTYDAPASSSTGVNSESQNDSPQARAWTVREARTLQAEHAMFDVLRQNATGTTSRSWTEIEPVLVAFNATQEDEQNTGKKLEQKLRLLQDALNDPGVGMKAGNGGGKERAFDLTDIEADGYKKDIAQTNRDALLKNLKEADFPGVCLPGGTLCKPF
jgi:RHS repeat-associated protein